METKLLPTYKELSVAIEEGGLAFPAAQLHGLLCGILCSPPKATHAWSTLLDKGQEGLKEKAIFQALYATTEYQLQDLLLKFQLLVPEDTEIFQIRAEALTTWVQGFLTGLKLVEISIVNREKDEVTEIINDLIEISNLDYENVTVDEENATAFAELEEYIRIAVISIYLEFSSSEKANANAMMSNQLH